MRHLRFWLRFLFVLAPLLVLAVGAIGFVRRIWSYLNSGARLAGALSVEATRLLGREVRVQDVKLGGSLWSLSDINRVELRGVSIADSPGPGYFARADRVLFHINLNQLIFSSDLKTPRINSVLLVAPQLTIIRDAQGHWNFSTLIKPSTVVSRPLVSKISFQDATLYASDYAFPHPNGVAPRPLITRVDRLTGTVLLRADKTTSFDVTGFADPKIAHTLHVTGIVEPKPGQIALRVVGDRVSLPFVGERALPPEKARIASGMANLDATLTASMTTLLNPKKARPQDFGVRASIQLSDLTATGSTLGAPVEKVNGSVTYVADTLVANVTGQYAGTLFQANGKVLGVMPSPGSVRPQPVLSVQGGLQHADFARLLRALDATAIKRLAPDVRRELQRASGQADLTFAVTGPLDNPAATLTGQIAHAQYDRYRVQNLAVQGFLADRRLNVQLHGRYAQGDVNARAWLVLSDGNPFQVDAHARNVQLAALGLPLKTPPQGMGSVDAILRGKRGTIPQATIQAQLSNVKLNNQALRRIYVRADTQGNDLLVHTLRVEDPKGVALAYGRIDLKKQQFALNVDADNLELGALALAAQQSTLGKQAPGFPAKRLPKALRNDDELKGAELLPSTIDTVSGVAYLRSRLTGPLRRPTLSGRLSGYAVQAGRVGLDKVTADFRLNHDRIVLQQVEADRQQGKATLAGVVDAPFSHKPSYALTLNADNFNIADLLDLGGIDIGDYSLVGTLYADNVVIRGEGERVRVAGKTGPDGALQPFHVRLVDAALNGQAVKLASVEGVYDHDTLRIQNATTEVAGGKLTASGTVDREGKVAVNVTGQGFQLETLAALLPEPPQPEIPDAPDADASPDIWERVQGQLNFGVNVTGTLKDPQAQATAEIQKFMVNGYELGRVSAAAHYANKQITLSDGQLRHQPTDPNSQVTIPALTYNLDSKEIQGNVHIQGLPAQEVREFIQSTLNFNSAGSDLELALKDATTGPFEGTISGDIAVSGKTRDPHAEIALKADAIRIAGYPAISLTAQAQADKKRVTIPTASLTSSEANIEVDARNALYEYGGALGGEISAYNVDLGFLQNAIPQLRPSPNRTDDLRRIQGVADNITVIASGTTAFPELQVSISLRNVAYIAPNPLPNDARATARYQQIYQDQRIDRIEFTGGTVRNTAQDDENATTPGKLIGNLSVLKRGTINRQDVAVNLTASGAVGFDWKPPYFRDEAALEAQTGTAEKPVIHLPLPAITLLTRTLLLSAQKTVDVTHDQPVVGDLYAGSEGAIDLVLRANGTVAEPKTSGRLAVSAPRVRFGKLATGLSDVNGVLLVQNGRLVVGDGFRAQTQVFGADGKPDPTQAGSQVTLKGRLPLGLNENEALADTGGISLHADRVVFNEKPLPGATTGNAKGNALVDLNLTGSLRHPALSGGITLSDTQATLPSDFGGVASSNELPLVDPTFNLRLSLGQNVRLSNSQLNARVGGDVMLAGSLSNPRLQGVLNLNDGTLVLPTARFTLLPHGTIRMVYPVYESNDFPTLELYANLQARTYLSATSLSGVRRRYQVTVTARGPLSGTSADPTTGASPLTLTFATDPPDLATDQQALAQRLTGILGGVDAFSQIGRAPGQAFASQLTNIFTSSYLPGVFDRVAEKTDFEELAIGYDPVQHLNITLSRRLFGPLYVTYIRSLTGLDEMYTLKVSLRFKERYQLSYETNEQSTQQVLLEGVFLF